MVGFGETRARQATQIASATQMSGKTHIMAGTLWITTSLITVLWGAAGSARAAEPHPVPRQLTTVDEVAIALEPRTAHLDLTAVKAAGLSGEPARDKAATIIDPRQPSKPSAPVQTAEPGVCSNHRAIDETETRANGQGAVCATTTRGVWREAREIFSTKLACKTAESDRRPQGHGADLDDPRDVDASSGHAGPLRRDGVRLMGRL